MNDDFRRIMVKRLRMVEEDLANVRQWYYSQPPSERQTFKKDLQALVEASKPFAGSCLTIEVKYQATAHAQDGETISVKASRSPEEILQAIDEWDNADEHDPSFI
ncbi:MAG TPA: hypothetical protein VKA46_07100 [Gemmataceae bacterium]|nr:hypothetical protein [Gemmataceae bacterium]